MSNNLSADSNTSSMWGGRFSEATDSFVAEFTASVNFDQRFANQDIDGSIAHATMLGKAGIITDAEKAQIVAGLEQVKQEIADGTFVWSVALEDVHMNVESRLTAIIGENLSAHDERGKANRCCQLAQPGFTCKEQAMWQRFVRNRHAEPVNDSLLTDDAIKIRHSFPPDKAMYIIP